MTFTMTSLKKLLFVSLTLCLSACDLTVNIVGDGAGTVDSDVKGIDCHNLSAQCTAKFSQRSEVTLTAQPQPDAVFVGWEGACTGTTPTCTLRMNMNREATARFATTKAPLLACDTDNAKAGCLTPTRSPEYYVDQSIKYFLTMESSVDISVMPNYSLLVARWEWHPWLLLTGFGNANMILTDILLKFHPTKYASIDCRAFDTQPFGRCHVVFDYSGELCPIYEEFTFNDQGEITFIEAWTDYPGLIPMANPADYWAEGENVKRLSTRIPGLGNHQGLIEIYGEGMTEAATEDADVADFQRRASKPYAAYFKEFATHAQQVARGCRPPS